MRRKVFSMVVVVTLVAVGIVGAGGIISTIV
jgi:hypothetical protein